MVVVHDVVVLVVFVDCYCCGKYLCWSSVRLHAYVYVIVAVLVCALQLL